MLTLYDQECGKLPSWCAPHLRRVFQGVVGTEVLKVASEKVAALYLSVGKEKFCNYMKAKLERSLKQYEQ